MDFGPENPRIKIILLGDSGEGKTNLISVSTGEKFNKDSQTTKASSFREQRYVTENGNIYLLDLWDTAGQEFYRSLNKIFIKNSKIVLVVYAIDNPKSFKEIDYWINYVKIF